MIRKILFAFSLFFCSASAALAITCPSVSSSTTITNSCTTGIVWTGGNLTIGTSSSSITITNTLDVAAIEANSSSLGYIANTANNTIGDGSTQNAIQNDSGSIIRGLYNYGSLTAENGVWNDGTITALYNYGSISSTNGGIWNNAGSINNVYNIGSITVGSGANGAYNNGSISTLTNQGSITVGNTGTGIANGGSGIITTINNSGSITVGSTGGGGSWGISNGGTISTLNNSGTIRLLDDGYGISNSSTITTLNNSGSINVVSGKGIWNSSGTITTLNNSGTINGGGGDILNDGTIITLNNYANLTGTNVGLNNTGTLGTFNNISSINLTSTDSGVGVANSGTFTTLNNLGSITVAGTNATAISNSSTINALNNYGTLTVGDGGSYTIYNSSSITTLTNSGSITTGTSGAGIYNDGSSTISTLTNTGSITAGTGGSGINNGGTITTLNNSQGGDGSSAATTALSYTGNSPTNYNIGIVSSTHYGKLVMDAGATIANVGIYGNPLVTSRTYAGVLANDVTVTSLQNRYDNMTVALVNNVATSAFDLTFTGVSLMGTQLSLSNNAAALTPIYTIQNSILANSFTYDCNKFDSHNVCISAGARNTNVSSAGGLSDGGALLIASYRPHPTYRIGAYIDQNLSVRNTGSTVDLDNNIPVIGLFAAWNQRVNGTGTEIKLSAAYGQKNATINRQIVGLSEFGSGSSTLDSKGAQLTAKYGFGLTKNIIISPYVGLRYTQNNMNGYTENNSTSLTAPLTYSALNTKTTTALAGLSASYRFIPQTTIFASAGLETILNTANSQYLATASGISGLTPVNFNPNPTRTRPTAILGAYYDLGKNQQIGIAGIYRQEAVREITTTTVMAIYTVGL